MNKILSILLAAVVLLSGCKDLIEPAIENNRQLDPADYVPGDARFPFGLLLNGYNRLPTNGWSFNDVATDDAVSNDPNNGYLKIALGQWTATNNPASQWNNSFAAIQYMNIALEEIEKAKLAADPVVSDLYKKRFKAEARGLRAIFFYHLLQNHAGVAQDGKLLGVPLLLSVQTPASEFNIPRATFEECMQQIYTDLDAAIEALPLDYEDVAGTGQIPSHYGNITVSQYNRVFGSAFRGFFTARIARAIKAQAALLAASPAYSAGSTTTWAQAANYAGAVLALKGGVGSLAANGLTWYSNASEITALKDGANPPEILWRNNYADNRDLEQANFPPTLFGSGRINPTQNLVDAFPMANGYPISDPNSGYNSNDPYAGRDPRLRTFILVNGGTAGPANTVITTAADGLSNDALNKVETSTRTGYYLRKLLRQDVNLNPNSVNNQRHYKPHIRYTEILLMYAEAANEAWGPTGFGEQSFSAYDVIKAIRGRAGVGTNNGDPYLEAAKTSKETMRALIRNERRLELCFEGFRFWDLRRWNANLTETAKGMSIRNGTYSIINVQERLFESYMNYGPIPQSETLKFSALQQNKGWQ
ncbi:RagB/SusD family nutrient uptake outer membrane protein [Parasegetibacter sp. NRK P23]|uniref:RagB/SusD family nutrient uptake outer membrane protein n=1 Tax=Parasegetibacter sp. NRK P23 TaxID=2942999 RepID=UPI002044351A|nr:RagB/SusD family nutrient uptake outer membrane protein [Parasegetibacter sp. NRK P23]MCM5529335.1 RagB/SusD family nutrient uptake outer membrane protein [Parasegetibacter sp. NRK P23]